MGRLETKALLRLIPVALSVTVVMWVISIAAARVQNHQLRLEHVGADTDAAFRVMATVIVGPTESVLWDGQYKVSDGKRLADRVAATGTRLKAIVISHADHDHYMGAMEVLKRFPDTPVYMAASTLADFKERSAQDLEAERKRPNADAPETLVTPQLLPQEPLTVDGNRLEVITDLGGDVRKPASSALWIPSLRAVLVADLAFSGIHPWLGDSDTASRAAWRSSIKKIADLKPAIVVAGHKADVAAPDTPEVLTFMQSYLANFDRLMQSAATPDDLVTAMRERYPELKLPGLMAAGARRNFKK